jgi:hypothetical protein
VNGKAFGLVEDAGVRSSLEQLCPRNALDRHIFCLLSFRYG